MESVTPVIDIADVWKTYQMGAETVHALRGCTFSVQPGEYVAVMGPSGSGKSTLMNIIGCLDVPTMGVYRLDGQDVGTLSDDALAHVRNRQIGFVFQTFNLLPRATALHNVELPLVYAGIPSDERKRRASEALERVQLGERMQHRPNELSGGQRQRVAIARALVNRPSILLADEPTGNLDSAMTREIMDLLDRINAAGTTIVMVTHSPECAERANRQLHVFDGRVVDVERPAITMARSGNSGLAATIG